MKIKPKALLFIGFRHKKDSIITAKKEGYKTILLTRKIINGASSLFDTIIEDNILDSNVIDKIIPKLKKKYRIKGVISNYEHYVVARSYLAEHFNVPSTSVYGACCSRNKAMQRHALKFMKENIKHRIVKTEKQATKAFHVLGENVFLKSIAGIKSRLIFHIKSEKQLHDAFKQIQLASEKLDEDLFNDFKYCDFNFDYPDPQKTFLIEKAEQGRQLTIVSLAGSHTIWHAPSACDVYTAADIDRNDSFLAFRILPSRFPRNIILKAQKSTETAARILGLRYCPLHCEVIINEQDEVKLIEIASRMGGYRPQMYKEAYNLDLNKLLVKSTIGKEVKARKKPKKYVSMIEIFARKDGRLVEILNYKDLKKDKTVKYFELLAKKGEKVGLAKNNYPPILRFLITGDTYEEVYDRSVSYHKNIKVKVR